MKPLTPLRLLLSNLQRRPFRTTALVLTVAVVTGGSGLLGALLRGLGHSVEVGTQRFGADLVVIPRGGRAATEAAMIVGRPTQMTLPAAAVATIARLPGVQQASAQVFVKTLTNARCCPGEFFLIGYDPATDFTLAPWLRQRGVRCGPHDCLVGDRVSLRDGERVTFFGTEFRVKAHLERTGVGIDATVFIPLAGVREMIASSSTKAVEPLTIRPDEISVVLVKVRPGVAASGVGEAIANHLQSVDLVFAPQVIGAAVKDLGSVLRLLVVVAVALWAVLLPLLATTFSMAVAERRREMGLWRALGCTSRLLFRLVLAEAALLTGSGAALGLTVAGVLTGAFGAVVAEAIGTPYLWPGWSWQVATSALIVAAAAGTGCLAAVFPARAAAALEPYACIRGAGG